MKKIKSVKLLKPLPGCPAESELFKCGENEWQINAEIGLREILSNPDFFQVEYEEEKPVFKVGDWGWNDACKIPQKIVSENDPSSKVTLDWISRHPGIITRHATPEEVKAVTERTGIIDGLEVTITKERIISNGNFSGCCFRIDSLKEAISIADSLQEE